LIIDHRSSIIAEAALEGLVCKKMTLEKGYKETKQTEIMGEESGSTPREAGFFLRIFDRTP
jgi:hypothetical protein